MRVPKRGEKRRLVEMVTHNAALVLGESEAKRSRRLERVEEGLAQLQEIFGLERPPRRIEAYDISNTQGSNTVASMVVLIDGVPDNREYRRFRIRGLEGPNDFAAMRQVVQRRFEHGLKERNSLADLSDEEREAAKRKAKFADFPDLVLIDGGKGQLSAARDVMRDLNLEDIPTIGLAERLEEILSKTRLGSDSPRQGLRGAAAVATNSR